jgi:hypothetical protein
MTALGAPPPQARLQALVTLWPPSTTFQNVRVKSMSLVIIDFILSTF